MGCTESKPAPTPATRPAAPPAEAAQEPQAATAVASPTPAAAPAHTAPAPAPSRASPTRQSAGSLSLASGARGRSWAPSRRSSGASVASCDSVRGSIGDDGSRTPASTPGGRRKPSLSRRSSPYASPHASPHSQGRQDSVRIVLEECDADGERQVPMDRSGASLSRSGSRVGLRRGSSNLSRRSSRSLRRCGSNNSLRRLSSASGSSFHAPRQGDSVYGLTESMLSRSDSLRRGGNASPLSSYSCAGIVSPPAVAAYSVAFQDRFQGQPKCVEDAYACVDAFRYRPAYEWFRAHVEDADEVVRSASIVGVIIVAPLREGWCMPEGVACEIERTAKKQLQAWLTERAAQSPACLTALAELRSSSIVKSRAVAAHPLAYYISRTRAIEAHRRGHDAASVDMFLAAVDDLFALAVTSECLVGGAAASAIYRYYLKGRTAVPQDLRKAQAMITKALRFETDTERIDHLRELSQNLQRQMHRVQNM